MVHAQAADSLWAVLTRRGLLAGGAAAPEAMLSAADAIEQAFASRGGFDEAAVVLARGVIAAEFAIAERRTLPLSVVRGV